MELCQQNSLYQLPEEIFQRIIYLWLDLFDVVFLDTAICSFGFRNKFIQIISKHEFGAWNEHVHFDSDAFKWFSLRGAVIMKLDIESFSCSPLETIELAKSPVWREVKELVIAHEMTDGEVLCIAPECSSLVSLDLGCNDKLSDFSLIKFSTCFHSLTSLMVYETSLTDDCITFTVQNCPYLKSLNINSCKNLTDLSIISIATHCKKLEELLMSNISISKIYIAAIIKSIPTLTILDISESQYISETTSFANIASSFSSQCLTNLNLSYNDIVDLVVVKITKNCPALTELNLAECEGIGSGPFETFCANLNVLNLHSCSNITDEAIISLSMNAPKLSDITLVGCFNITNAAYESLLKGCPNIHTLRLGTNDFEVSTANMILNANISDKTMNVIAKYSSPVLKRLELFGCLKVSGFGILSILSSRSHVSNSSTTSGSSCVSIGTTSTTPFSSSDADSEGKSNPFHLRLEYCNAMDDDMRYYVKTHLPSFRYNSFSSIQVFEKLSP